MKLFRSEDSGDKRASDHRVRPLAVLGWMLLTIPVWFVVEHWPDIKNLGKKPAAEVKQVVPAIKHTTPERGDYAAVETFDEKDLQQAALDRLYPRINPPNSWSYSLEDVKQARVRLECARAWAAQLPNRQVSAAYLDWINYYSVKYNQMERDRLHPEQAAPDPRVAEREAAQARANALKIPKPPSQICQSTRTEFKGKMGDSK